MLVQIHVEFAVFTIKTFGKDKKISRFCNIFTTMMCLCTFVLSSNAPFSLLVIIFYSDHYIQHKCLRTYKTPINESKSKCEQPSITILS